MVLLIPLKSTLKKGTIYTEVIEMLEKEYQYFLKHKDALLKQYEGTFVVIIGNEVVGSYSSREEALREASSKYDIGTFLIQKVSPGEDDVIQRFSSRVYVHK